MCLVPTVSVPLDVLGGFRKTVDDLQDFFELRKQLQLDHDTTPNRPCPRQPSANAMLVIKECFLLAEAVTNREQELAEAVVEAQPNRCSEDWKRLANMGLEIILDFTMDGFKLEAEMERNILLESQVAEISTMVNVLRQGSGVASRIAHLEIEGQRSQCKELAALICRKDSEIMLKTVKIAELEQSLEKMTLSYTRSRAAFMHIQEAKRKIEDQFQPNSPGSLSRKARTAPNSPSVGSGNILNFGGSAGVAAVFSPPRQSRPSVPPISGFNGDIGGCGHNGHIGGARFSQQGDCILNFGGGAPPRPTSHQGAGGSGFYRHLGGAGDTTAGGRGFNGHNVGAPFPPCGDSSLHIGVGVGAEAFSPPPQPTHHQGSGGRGFNGHIGGGGLPSSGESILNFGGGARTAALFSPPQPTYHQNAEGASSSSDCGMESGGGGEG